MPGFLFSEVTQLSSLQFSLPRLSVAGDGGRDQRLAALAEELDHASFGFRDAIETRLLRIQGRAIWRLHFDRR
ncbi:MAG: hypothetical protein KatS3mg012_0982 [Gaiellaceae bacterium]|nr:MAG: hypothetical protein KatS3mg012_0982 [Gaiellaceae bacterium]